MQDHAIGIAGTGTGPGRIAAVRLRRVEILVAGIGFGMRNRDVIAAIVPIIITRAGKTSTRRTFKTMIIRLYLK